MNRIGSNEAPPRRGAGKIKPQARLTAQAGEPRRPTCRASNQTLATAARHCSCQEPVARASRPAASGFHWTSWSFGRQVCLRGVRKVGPRPLDSEFQGPALGTPVSEPAGTRQPAVSEPGPRLTSPCSSKPIRAHGSACLPAVWFGPEQVVAT